MGTSGLRLLAAAGLVLVAVGAPAFSSATFTSTTTAPAGVTSAADWTAPAVAVTNPGTVSGAVVVAATATDQHGTVAGVTIQRSAGGAWTPLCADETAPYTCGWDTTAVVDGAHELRAVAVDTAGNIATSLVVTATVANAASVTLGPLAELVRGNVPLSASVSAPGSASVSLRIQYAPAGTTSWSDVPGCTTTGRTLGCTWNTGQLADIHDVRARAVVGTQEVVDVLQDVVVDNAPPSVGLTVPSGTLSGTVVLTSAADDALSGVDTVAFQYAPAGSQVWTALCADDAQPFTCDWRTSTVADGSYTVRAVATDLAGNTTVTQGQQRTVNNTVASVSVTSPGGPVSGTVEVGADAASTKGVKNLVLRWAPAGTSTWTTICTDSTAPYSCAWDTTTATPTTGTFDVQAVMTDNANGTLTSSRVAVAVDNSPLRALDVQAVNGSSAGRIQPGDQLVLTYSAVLNPATVVAGWDGTGSRALTVNVNQSGNQDTLGFAGANLGQVALLRNFVSRNVTVTSSIAHTVSTTGGVSRSVVTVTFGAASDDAALRRTSGTTHMVWTPSTSVRTLGGASCAATPVAETGAKDRDF